MSLEGSCKTAKLRSLRSLKVKRQTRVTWMKAHDELKGAKFEVPLFSLTILESRLSTIVGDVRCAILLYTKTNTHSIGKSIPWWSYYCCFGVQLQLRVHCCFSTSVWDLEKRPPTLSTRREGFWREAPRSLQNVWWFIKLWIMFTHCIEMTHLAFTLVFFLVSPPFSLKKTNSGHYITDPNNAAK